MKEHRVEGFIPYFRGLCNSPSCVRKRRTTVLVLALFAVLATVSAAFGAGEPYIQACSVAAINRPSGLETQLGINIVDPNGTLPGSLVSAVVTGPGVFSYDLKMVGNCGSTGCGAIVPVAPSTGTYTFTVTDNEGKTATSTSYLQVAATVPLVDSATFTATGSLSNVTLSWSAPTIPDTYAGNLFYLVTIQDDVNGTMRGFGPTNNTSVSATLNPSHSYQWWVAAGDQYSPWLTNNGSLTYPETLAPSSEQPAFLYATVFNRHKADGTFATHVAAKLVDPNGTLPGSIASIVVTGPGGFSTTFDATSDPSVFDSTSQEFSKQVPGKPLDGIYTFTVTDADNHTATTYDYLLSRDVPLIDTGTMQASGDPLQPMLSWGLPIDMTAPLYFVAIVYDASGTTEVWRSDIVSNPAVQMPVGTLQVGASYSWRVRTLDSRYGLQWNRSDTAIIAMTIDNATPFFTWYGVYYRHDNEGYWTALDVQVRDPDGTPPTTIQSLTVTGPDSFAYTFLPADYSAGDDEFFKKLPGIPASGVYTFTLTDVDNRTAVTHSFLNPPQQIPLVDPAGLAVNGDPLAPIVSWKAVAGYPGRLHYRLRVIDSQDNPVWSSARSFWTAVTIPVGKLTAGNSYRFRVEAQDDRDYPIYSSRSNTSYYPLAVPFVLPAPDLTGKWKKLKSTNFGKTISGEMLVNNIGDDPAGPFTVKCYSSKDGKKLGKLVKTIKVGGGLPSGQSKVLPLSYKSKTSLKNYYMVAIVDASKLVAERNETNNTMTKKIK